jgi:uncharacterized membrane protein
VKHSLFISLINILTYIYILIIFLNILLYLNNNLAFKSPSKHTAEIFKAVLKEYDGVFKIIHFAILKGVDNENTMTKNYNKLPKDNYDIFKEVFDKN